MRTVPSIILLLAVALSSPAAGNNYPGRDKRDKETKTGVTRRNPDDNKEKTRVKSAQRQDKPRKVDAQTRPKGTETKTRQPEKQPVRTEPRSGRTKQADRSPESANPQQNPSTETNPWEKTRTQSTRQTVQKHHKDAFENVRSGLNSGRVGSFSDLLGKQVYINLRDGETGYFSSSQAYYVLDNYLRTNKFKDFQFSTMEQSGDIPYATGRGEFNHKGVSEAAQVYVSLTQDGERWVISQIKIH